MLFKGGEKITWQGFGQFLEYIKNPSTGYRNTFKESALDSNPTNSFLGNRIDSLCTLGVSKDFQGYRWDAKWFVRKGEKPFLLP